MRKPFLKDRLRYIRWIELHFLALVGAQAQEVNAILNLIFL